MRSLFKWCLRHGFFSFLSLITILINKCLFSPSTRLDCIFVEGQHITTLTTVGGTLTDRCPTEFQEYENKEFTWSIDNDDQSNPDNAIPQSYPTGTYTLSASVSLTCYQTRTFYCPCKTGYGYFIGDDEVNVCCLERDIEETFHLEVNGIPDHFAQVIKEDGSGFKKLVSGRMFYDIPACPHKYIDLQNLNRFQDQNSRDALGDWPVGFATNGVPIFHPFGENGYKVNTSDFDRCGGSLRDSNRGIPQYVYYGHMPCLNFTGSNCRDADKSFGMNNPSCTPLDGTDAFNVAGYAVDGFRIYQSNFTIFGDDELDNCNGKFTLNPETGLYTYAYYVTQREIPNQAYFPYIIGCLGPGKYYKNGSLIDYTGLQGLIDTTCDYDIPLYELIGLSYEDPGFLYSIYVIGALIFLIGLIACIQQTCQAPLRRRKEMKFYSDRWHFIEQERMV